MNLGSNASSWIPLLPKISNAPQICCLSASLRGLIIFTNSENLSTFLEYAGQSLHFRDGLHLATSIA